MSSFPLRLKTFWKLGLTSIAQVAVYRAACTIGLYRLLLPIRRWSAGSEFFSSNLSIPPSIFAELKLVPPECAEALLDGNLTFFSGKTKHVGSPPDWFQDPFSGLKLAHDQHWTKLNEFSSADIKTVWETSRFDWVLLLARAWRASGDSGYLDTLNQWIQDWVSRNPSNAGPNWKCGQEASIRVMHLAMAALILGQADAPANGLVELVRTHLQRIAPTIHYAVAQDNNHGTSEAAALFIGGSWLQSAGVPGADRWQRQGRKWLENRAVRLIEADGSFSQYSLNYHRVLLDTFSMVEVWRRQRNLASFSTLFQKRAAAASSWLAAMVDPHSGEGPNLGANDGARLLPLTDTDYRDFRPSVQLAMALFTDKRTYPADGSWNLPLAWLGVALPESQAAPGVSQVFDDGGYGVLKRSGVMLMLRFPRFRFRPGQADALHVDLWRAGENLLRDAGSYSYNTEPEWLNYFPGTASHNTVQFDDRDQMPRLSRFLFGDWLKTESLQPLVENAEETSFGAAYRDGKGASHQRQVRLKGDCLIVRDKIEGFQKKAVLRWRVRPGQWRLDGQMLTDGEHVITVSSDVPLARVALVNGWESRYYLQKNEVPVLEVEIQSAGMLTTEYRWQL